MTNNKDKDNEKPPNRRSFLGKVVSEAFVVGGIAKAVMETGSFRSAQDINVASLDVGHTTKQLMRDAVEHEHMRVAKGVAAGTGIASAAALTIIGRDKANVERGVTRRQFIPAVTFVGAGATAMGTTYSGYHAGRSLALEGIVSEVKPNAPKDDHRQLDKLKEDAQQATEQPIRDGFTLIKTGVTILSLKGLYDLNKKDRSR